MPKITRIRMNQINTREKELMKALTLRSSKGKIARAYCEKFGVVRDTFHRRLRKIEFAPEEKAFFEQYFENQVTGGKDLLKKVDQGLRSGSQ